MEAKLFLSVSLSVCLSVSLLYYIRVCISASVQPLFHKDILIMKKEENQNKIKTKAAGTDCNLSRHIVLFGYFWVHA